MGLFGRENQSEVARIRAEIDDQCTSLQMMNQFGVTGRHDIVANKFKQVDGSMKQLAGHIGEEEATKFVCETYTKKVR